MLTITIPYLPPAVLSPNSRLHWAKKVGPKIQVKNDVMILAKEAAQKEPKGTYPLERAVIRFKYGLPNKRVRDMDNLVAASKAMLDALKGIIIVDDNVGRIILERPEWFDSPKNPQTVIEVTYDYS